MKATEALRKKKEASLARFNARIAQAQRIEDHRERREETRYKIILGGCLLADIEANPEIGVLLEESLKRTANDRDAEFLRSKGWKI